MVERRADNRIRFIYFDIGNVIFDFRPSIIALSKEARRTLPEVEAVFRELDSGLCSGKVEPQELWRQVKKDKSGKDIDLLDFWVENFSPFPEVHQLITEVSEKYPVGLFTNIFPGAFELMITKGKIPNLSYAAVVQSHELGILKQEPRGFEVAEKLAGLKGPYIYLLDDSAINVELAKGRKWQASVFNPDEPAKSSEEVRKLLLVA